MLTSSLLISAAGIPAALVATGVLGALETKVRMRAVVRKMTSRGRSAGAIPMLIPIQDAQPVVECDDDSKLFAIQLLDAWSRFPRSTWYAVGARMLRTSRSEAGAVTASQLILEGVLAHHALTVDAWMVRDAADTAWFLAPQDEGAPAPAISLAARRAVTNAALALLARAWLPVEDFERLSARIEP